MRALAILLLAAASPATPDTALVAILEFRNEIPGVDVKTNRDGDYLADVARTSAVQAGLQVMTRENVSVLLAANGKDPSDCIGKCEIETGRLLGARFVVTGALIQFGKQLRLSMRLHDTSTGMMLMGAAVGGAELAALEAGLPDAVSRLIGPVIARTGSVPADDSEVLAARLAESSNQKLLQQDFRGAVADALTAVALHPKESLTLGSAYRSLGYGYAYLDDKTQAVRYLSEYLPYCTIDCAQVRQFGSLAQKGPEITFVPIAAAPEGIALTIRAKIRTEAPPIATAKLIAKRVGEPASAPHLELGNHADFKGALSSWPLTPGAGDEYMATIPAAEARGTVEYLIWAKDAAGVTSVQGADRFKAPWTTTFKPPKN
jgi:hypothetical protein